MTSHSAKVGSNLRAVGLSLCLAVSAIAASAALGAPAIAQSTSCTATAAEFGALRDGMTVSEVERIIGCRGEVLSESNVGGIHTIMLAWRGSGSLGANMNAMFQGGRMVMKSQFGLR